ncbi:regulator [Streptomyces fodineus]|uniref:Regulator n=1 Tax=Streptomyces fodineus TaxID=1904616 RepID=A0A1D7YEM8_9ACTN|nr:ATP-binding protein [Streptomyces fodineus]AOR34063.1 regulator [Streptomyces fodineus]
MGYNEASPPRQSWDLPFTAEPEEVATLRRLMRLHLGLWGLEDVVEAAQLCVSELVTNVITHVGLGTPTTLAVSMNGTYVRIEVRDPDTRALPTLLDAGIGSESGRGMRLVASIAARWGVELRAHQKVTWCELSTAPVMPCPVNDSPRLSRAEGLLDLYKAEQSPRAASAEGHRLRLACAEETAINIIADLLHWLHAHGRDADDVLDRAQAHFEAGTDVPA